MICVSVAHMSGLNEALDSEAGLLELRHLVQNPADSTSPGLLALGAGLSFVVGMVALWWLVRWVEQGHLYRFAWWVLLLGPIVILWQLFGT